MSEVPEQAPSSARAAPRRRRGRGGRIGLWMVLANLLVFLILIYAGLSLSARPIPLPGWAAARIDATLDAAIAPASVDIARVEVMVGRDGLPRAFLRDVTLRDAGGAEVARLNNLSARLSPAALALRRLAPGEVMLEGAQITVRRAADGRFAVSFGAGATGDGAPASISAVLAGIEAAFAEGPLAGVTHVAAGDVTIALEDARTGRIWQASNASLDLRRDEAALTLAVISDVFNGTEDLARVQLSFRSELGGGASIGAQIEGMPSEDIALQSPALSFLSLVSAPIDGSMRASFDAGGALTQVAASLDVGAGALRPSEDTVFAVSGGRVYLTFDPGASRIAFSEISVDSEALTLSAAGHAYLRDTTDGWPARLVGQFRLEEAEIRREDLLAVPLVFDGGAADLNLRLDPFEVEIGQIVLTRIEGDTRRDLRARGTLAAVDGGLATSVDFEAAHLTPDEVLALWPVTAIPNTRRWIAENVQGGDLLGIAGALRLAPGTPARTSISYEFRDAEVRFLPHFPPITGGQGRAAFTGTGYTMTLNEGAVVAPGGGQVDLAGSTFAVPDLTRVPDRAEIVLKTTGPLRAALEIMDNEPFEVLRKSGMRPEVFEASAEATTRIAFDLVKRITPDMVFFETSGTLSDVRLAGLPGIAGALEADRLDVSIDPKRLEVSGNARLGEMPVSGRWTQPLAPEEAGASRVVADLTLSPESLSALGLRLDGVAIDGATEAQLELDLPRGAPATFRVSSDLAGAAIGLPGTGWSKPRTASGALEVAGSLGETPRIDTLRIDAPGLSAEGALRFGAEGAFAGADFSRVRLGGWLDAPVSIRAAAGGSPEIAVVGGRVDLRNRPDTGAAPGPQRSRLSLALDELVLSDTISLRPFSAFVPAGGGAGRFDTRVNGGTAIGGDIVPRADGMAFRITSDDGGGVLNDARILPGASGGSFALSLVPDGGPGRLQGQMRLEGPILRDAPAAARLLDSMSVIGLLDDLQGQGIRFDTVDARFRIGNGLLRIDDVTAVGGSLGITLNGLYDLEAKRMDLQGVVSPLYVLNGIGSIFTRRGEGVFGMSFRMAGSAASPTVTVNPLSMLAPGMFREVFRRPPPDAPATQ